MKGRRDTYIIRKVRKTLERTSHERKEDEKERDSRLEELKRSNFKGKGMKERYIYYPELENI